MAAGVLKTVHMSTTMAPERLKTMPSIPVNLGCYIIYIYIIYIYVVSSS